MSWYETKTTNHQGHIADEKTGNSIAVAYDKKDAALIAAAPDLLESVGALLHCLETPGDMTDEEHRQIRIDALNALDNAKGEA